jgi:hypothetical protein
MSINSKKSNLMQVISWMKTYKFMKEEKQKPNRNKGGKSFRKKNFKK